MEDYNYQYFRPRRSAKNVILFLVAFSLFMTGGLIIYFFARYFTGIIIAGLGFLALTTMTLKIMAVGTRYAIGVNSVLIKNLYNKIIINARDISSVSLLSREEIAQFFNKSYWPVVEAEREMNIAKWYKASKYYGMLTRFVSVPLVYSSAGSGIKTNITGLSTSITGSAVLLQTASHGFVFITPADPEQYVTRLRSLGIREVRPADFMEQDLSGEGVKKMHLMTTPGGLKTYSLLSFILLTAGIFAFFFYLQPSENPEATRHDSSYSGEPVLTNEQIIYMNGRWENDSVFYFVAKDTDLGESEKEGEITMGMIRKVVFPAVWKSFFSENHITEIPVPDQGIQSTIELWLTGQPDYRQVGSFLTEEGEKYWLYEQRSNGMKQVYFGIISNSISQE